MSAATSPGTGLAYGLQRVCAAWGFARSSFYAMKSRQQATADAHQQMKPSISRGSAGGHRGRPGGIPLGGRGTPQGLARLRAVVASVFPAGCSGLRENNLLSPHRCRRRGGNPHVGENHPCPQPHVGHGRRSGVRGGRRLGLDIHRHRALERRVRRLACVQARRPLRRPSADEAYASSADGSRLPVSVSPTRSSSGASSRPTPSEQPQTTASPVQSTLGSSMAASTATSRRKVRQYNAPRLPEPRQLVRRGTPRCHSGPPHETNLCPRNRVRYTFSSRRDEGFA